MKASRGKIMQLQHFSVNDGEGIRTTIFLGGCPLRCKWCSNPESWEIETNNYVKTMSLDEIITEINRYIIFYRYSNGGITYSGGEPTFQKQFLREMVNAFYNKGIHQSIETSGYFDLEDVKDIFEKLDFIFIDIKHMDNIRHKELTGVSNRVILENIKSLGKLNKEIVVRIPFVKDINDSEKNIRETASFVYNNIPNGKIELLPYHSLGNYKYDSLELENYKNIFITPDKDEVEAVKKIIEDIGVQTIEYK
jgi:pyruvate formate lyase activating enzyme